jgi:hypothetical protein
MAPERRKIIFDPLPRVDGIASAGDPLTAPISLTFSTVRPRR